MQTIIVDKKTFVENPNFYVKTLQEFVPDINKNVMMTTLNYGGFYFFAFADNGEVTTWGRTAMPFNRKTLYCIRQIETKQNYRRQGYAEACYKACEEYITKNNTAIRKIYTFVDEENAKSIAFHEKIGYKRVKNVSNYLLELHGWEGAIMFEKRLEKILERQL